MAAFTLIHLHFHFRCSFMYRLFLKVFKFDNSHFVHEISFLSNIKIMAFQYSFRNSIIGPQAVAGRVLWNRVCLSVLLSGHFLWIVSLTCSKFWHGARNPYEVVCDSWIFQENFFCPKNGENGPKTGFFEFIGKLSH